MSIAKKLESVLNAGKVRFECSQHPEEQDAIVVAVQRNGETLIQVVTDTTNAKKLIETLK